MSNQTINTVQIDFEENYEQIDEIIDDFDGEITMMITARMFEKDWCWMPFRWFLPSITPNGFRSQPTFVLETHIHEVNKHFVTIEAEKDFVHVGTNINQMIARMVYGVNKAIYPKFNKLRSKGKHNVKIGNKPPVKLTTYTFDPEHIDLFKVDLLKVNQVDHKHFKSKCEEEYNLPYKLRFKFTNTQSESGDSNERWKAQEAISQAYSKGIDKLLFSGMPAAISTFNENVKTTVDLTHDRIFDTIIESIFDLKRVYCYLFDELRLCFVKAEDIGVTDKNTIITIDGVDYCIGCLSFSDRAFVISLSDTKYRQKMKNFITGEHINYDPSNPGKGLGDVSIKPSGFYYRVWSHPK